MAEIHVPTLEELDNWSGSIDALPYSLDSSVWLSADLWETTASGATAITATASCGVQRHAVGTAAPLAITATATGREVFEVTGSGALVITGTAFAGWVGTASIAITATATPQHIEPVSGTAALALTETSSLLGTFVMGASGPLALTAATETSSLLGTFVMAGTAELALPTVALVAEELGETWSVVSAGGETWSLAA